MLLFPLTSLLFLLPPSLAKVSPKSHPVNTRKLFQNGIIVEFDGPSHLHKRDEVVQHVARALSGTRLTPSLKYDSTIFTGYAYGVDTSHGNGVDDKSLRNAVLQVPGVKAIYANRAYELESPAAAEPRAPRAPRTSAVDATLQDLAARAYVMEDAPITPMHMHEARADAGTSSSDVVYDVNGGPFANPHNETGVERLHAEGIVGARVRVAVIDNGFDTMHPALGGGFGPGFKVYNGTDVTGDGPGKPAGGSPQTECKMHGTGTASIVAGLPWHFGTVGVAPNASLEVYKVAECDTESIYTQFMMKAAEMAFLSGVDVISMSIGGPGGFDDDPMAIMVDRINALGTPFIVSAGNSGDQGLFSTSSAGDGFNTPNVASSELSYAPALVADGSYSVNGNAPVAFQYSPGYPNNFPQPVEVLWAPQYNGCVTVPGVAKKADQVVMYERPWPQHKFSECPLNATIPAAASGLRNLIMYNYVDEDPGRPLQTFFVENFPSKLDGLATMDKKVALEILAHAQAGDRVTLSLPWKADQEKDTRKLRLIKNTVSAGRMSNFSSWGPTYETKIGPAVTAPGGWYLQLAPRMYGGLQVARGTSFSCPYVAGVFALFKGIDKNISQAEILNRISATARPMAMQSASQQPVPGNLLAPTFQQGAGLIDAYAAVHATIVLNTSSLNFNDTTHLLPQTFEIRNTGKTAVEVTLDHSPAATVYTFDSGSTVIDEPDEEDWISENVINRPASLTFYPQSNPQSTGALHLEPGKTVAVTVAAQVPAGLDAARLPMLSGFIKITTSAGDVLTLPYGLVGSSLHNVPVLDQSGNDTYLIRASFNEIKDLDQGEAPAPVDGTNQSDVFTLPRRLPADDDALANITLPGWCFTPHFGSRKVDVRLLRRGIKDLGQAVWLGGVGNGPYPAFIARLPYLMLWDGTVMNSTGDAVGVENGTYSFAIRLLRLEGDERKQEDYDTIITRSFSVNFV